MTSLYFWVDAWVGMVNIMPRFTAVDEGRSTRNTVASSKEGSNLHAYSIWLRVAYVEIATRRPREIDKFKNQ